MKRSIEEQKLRTRELYLKRKYGLSLCDYENMLARQAYSCAVCFKHQKDCKRRLAVDHNHKTGKVRGLLCGYCNHRLVGKYTLATARKVYQYLLTYEGE